MEFYCFLCYISGNDKHGGVRVKIDWKKLKPSRRGVKKCCIITGIIFLIIALYIAVSNILILSLSSSRTFETVDDLPECEAALVLGCSPYVPGTQRPNLFFHRRLNAAAELYHSGKVKKLIVSGDNSREGYNEPEAMRQELIARGVPDEDIYCDYAGFSTLDSVIRAEDIFSQRRYIIISQGFHGQRAVFLARIKGQDVYAFAAEDIRTAYWRIKNHTREILLARPKALLDILLFRGAKFSGEKVDLSTPQVKAD